MLPSHTITAFTPVTINAGHPTAVKVVAGQVSFDLSSFILRPNQPAQEFLRWIDDRLSDDQATLSMYGPGRIVELLSQLPDVVYSSGFRSLASGGNQPIIRLQVEEKGRVISLHKACAQAHIACASTDPTERFVAWVKGDIDQIAVDTEIDASRHGE